MVVLCLRTVHVHVCVVVVLCLRTVHVHACVVVVLCLRSVYLYCDVYCLVDWHVYVVRALQ